MDANNFCGICEEFKPCGCEPKWIKRQFCNQCFSNTEANENPKRGYLGECPNVDFHAKTDEVIE
jgi:hypothetical protein